MSCGEVTRRGAAMGLGATVKGASTLPRGSPNLAWTVCARLEHPSDVSVPDTEANRGCCGGAA